MKPGISLSSSQENVTVRYPVPVELRACSQFCFFCTQFDIVPFTSRAVMLFFGGRFAITFSADLFFFHLLQHALLTLICRRCMFPGQSITVLGTGLN